MPVGARSRRILLFASLALVAGATAARGQPAPEPRKYVRGQQGAEKPPGVVDGYLPGMHLADVPMTRDYLRDERRDFVPPVRCWWNRVDVWNGYVYSPRRFRVCQ